MGQYAFVFQRWANLPNEFLIVIADDLASAKLSIGDKANTYTYVGMAAGKLVVASDSQIGLDLDPVD